MIDMMVDVLSWVAVVVFLASIFCAVTDTPKAKSKARGAYRWVETMALNIGKAKH